MIVWLEVSIMNGVLNRISFIRHANGNDCERRYCRAIHSAKNVRAWAESIQRASWIILFRFEIALTWDWNEAICARCALDATIGSALGMKKESNCVRISESGTVCETIPDSNHPLNLYQRFNEWLFMSVAQIFKIATVRVAGFLLADVNRIV